MNILDSRPYNVARFVSEYGFQSYPFLRVWKKDTVEKDLIDGFNSHFVTFRQHQAGGNARVFSQAAAVFIPQNQEQEFKTSKFNKLIFITQVTDERSYLIFGSSEDIFFAQVCQAVATRVEAEKHRRKRNSYDAATGLGYTMGSMYWQLNDIWAAPSWGGIGNSGLY